MKLFKLASGNKLIVRVIIQPDGSYKKEVIGHVGKINCHNHDDKRALEDMGKVKVEGYGNIFSPPIQDGKTAEYFYGAGQESAADEAQETPSEEAPFQRQVPSEEREQPLGLGWDA